MANINTSVGAPSGGRDVAPNSFLATPDKYTALGELLNAAAEEVNELGKPDVSDLLVETYGDQGVTGFLKLTGAITAAGASDQVEFYEVGRRHKKLAYTGGNTTAGNGGNTAGNDRVTISDSAIVNGLQTNDVVMDTTSGVRGIVISGGEGSNVVIGRLDGAVMAGDSTDFDATNGGTLIVIGNMYAQGSDQPSSFVQPEVIRRINSYAIVKDRYQVNGSQATNIGYVNIGNGDYRWFMYGEQEARKRFMDKREMTLLFGDLINGAQKADVAVTDSVTDLSGTEGYITALENRGINVTNANANPLDSFAEFDDIILELDKQGAPAEYAMYLNRKQDLAIDDMLASGIATQVTAGLAGQFGAFNNSADMAIKLGFKSFTRGGYTFHKHDWKLLNDPTLLGASTKFQGVMCPLTQVTDARSGMKAPALEMKYKASNGYSREMEHWVTGGGVLGHNNNGDAGKDVATFHYRSEVALLTRAANQHVLIKG
jgi:hypothetical protein